MTDNANNNTLLSIVNACKSFGRVKVLKDINLEIGTNEIVGLVGDNGAGKSTLTKVITGVYSLTSGDIYYKGQKITIHSVKRSRELGIETIYQERALADQQSLWINMFIGKEITDKFGFLNVKKQKQETERMLRERMGYTSSAITIDMEVKDLSGGEKQGVAISRALFFDADLIILDEPTASLSLSEAKKVQDFVVDIKRSGKSAIFISHNISHLYPVCERFIIMDRGRIAGVFFKNDVTQEKLIEKMIQLARTGILE